MFRRWLDIVDAIINGTAKAVSATDLKQTGFNRLLSQAKPEKRQSYPRTSDDQDSYRAELA
jgi:hypothetical protein